MTEKKTIISPRDDLVFINQGTTHRCFLPPKRWGGTKWVLPPQSLGFWGGTKYCPPKVSDFGGERLSPKVVPPQNFSFPPRILGGNTPILGGNASKTPKIRSPPSVWGANFRQNRQFPPRMGGNCPPKLLGSGGEHCPPRPLRSGGAIPVSPPNLRGKSIYALTQAPQHALQSF